MSEPFSQSMPSLLDRPTLTRAAALSLLAAAATVSPLGAQTLTPLRIGTPGGDTFAEPFFGADQGFFAKAGFDPQISLLNNSGAAIAAVAGGSIDVGLGDIVGISDAIENGIPLVVFAGAGMYTSSEPTTILCVDQSGPITTAKDLNGKTVGIVTLVGLAAAATRAWLAQNGADLSTIHFTELPQSEMLPALERGTIAAATIVEPFLTAAKSHVRFLGKPYDAVAPRFLIGQWITTRDWLAKNEAGAKRLVAAIYETARWANAHHEESLASLVKYLKINPDRMRGVTRAVFSTTLTPALIQPVIDVAVRYHLIKTPLDAKTMIAQLT